MIFNYVMTYSDTYGDKSFKGAMIPSVIAFDIPEELTQETVYKRIVEIHHLLQLQKISEDFKVVADDEGYDWYGKNGYNAYTLRDVVCGTTGWKKVYPNTIFIADFDTM